MSYSKLVRMLLSKKPFSLLTTKKSHSDKQKSKSHLFVYIKGNVNGQ